MTDTPTESMSSPDPPPDGGGLIGRYRLLRALGHGGMGAVHLAEDTVLHRRVALKLSIPGRETTDETRKRMLAEARQAGLINHPGVAAVHDVFEWNDGVVIVMEYVEGQTLRDAVPGILEPARFRDVAGQIVDAVAAAHARGVVHRDLKPDNVMLTGAGRIKILDFGIAKRLFVDEQQTSITTETLEEHLTGTPAYMAPEALLGHEVDERADVFSLGVFFYEMLCGERPFDGGSRSATLNRILSGEHEPLPARNPSVPPALAAVVERMLAREPAARFADAQAVAAALDAAEAGIAPRLPKPPTKRPDRMWLGIVAALLVLAGGYVGYRVLGGRDAALPPAPNVTVLRMSLGTGGDELLALGLTEAVTERLQRITVDQPLQVAAVGDVVQDGVNTERDAAAKLGANVVLRTSLEKTAGRYAGRMELVRPDGSILRTRRIGIEDSALPLADTLTSAAFELLDVTSSPEPAARFFGTEGAGSFAAYLSGLGAAQQEQYDVAGRDFTRAVNIDPGFARAYAGLGDCAYRRYRAFQPSADWSPEYAAATQQAIADSALADGRRALAADSSCAEAYRLMGLVYSRCGKPDSAAAALEMATRLNPADNTSFLGWARVYGHQGDIDAEEQVYRREVEAQPYGWRPLWSLAALLYKKGEFEEAEARSRAMIDLVPDYYLGYVYLGGLYVQQGRYADAVRSLERSIALRPTEEAVSNLGTAYFNQGDFDAAIRIFNSAFQYGFTNYLLWINLGDAYYWSPDRRDKAKDAYRQGIAEGNRSLQGRSYDVWILGNLAPVYARIGEPDSARAALARALDGNEGNPTFQYDAALTWWELGEPDTAVAWLGKAVAGGFPVRWIEDSPMFEAWHEVPEFRDLVNAAGDTGAPGSKGGS